MSTTTTRKALPTELCVDTELMSFILNAARNEHDGDTGGDLEVTALDPAGDHTLIMRDESVTHGPHLYERCEIRCQVTGASDAVVATVDVRQRWLLLTQMAYALHIGYTSAEIGLD